MLRARHIRVYPEAGADSARPTCPRSQDMNSGNWFPKLTCAISGLCCPMKNPTPIRCLQFLWQALDIQVLSVS